MIRVALLLLLPSLSSGPVAAPIDGAALVAPGAPNGTTLPNGFALDPPMLPGGKAGQEEEEEGSGFLHNLNELFAPVDVLRDIGHLGTDSWKQNAVAGGSVVALTALAVEELDDVAFRREPDSLGGVNDVMRVLGARGFLYPALISTFFVGKAIDRPGVSRTAAQMTQALLLTDILSVPLKMAVGRTRPDESNDFSFPSGHVAGAFAIATVLQHNYGYKVGVPAFAFGVLMGASRIDERKHFLSDTIAGAGIGFFAASAINKRFPGRRIDVRMVRGPSGGRGIRCTFEF